MISATLPTCGRQPSTPPVEIEITERLTAEIATCVALIADDVAADVPVVVPVFWPY
jgi:hypothetical protein